MRGESATILVSSGFFHCCGHQFTQRLQTMPIFLRGEHCMGTHKPHVIRLWDHFMFCYAAVKESYSKVRRSCFITRCIRHWQSWDNTRRWVRSADNQLYWTVGSKDPTYTRSQQCLVMWYVRLLTVQTGDWTQDLWHSNVSMAWPGSLVTRGSGLWLGHLNGPYAEIVDAGILCVDAACWWGRFTHCPLHTLISLFKLACPPVPQPALSRLWPSSSYDANTESPHSLLHPTL